MFCQCKSIPSKQNLTQALCLKAVLANSTVHQGGSTGLNKGGFCLGLCNQVFVPKEAAPDKGCLQANVELTTLCSQEVREGRQTDVPSLLTQQVRLMNLIMHNALPVAIMPRHE